MKNLAALVIICSLICVPNAPVFSQGKADSMAAPTAPVFFNLKRNERQVGLNMTPLISQLLPFNRSNPLISGPFTVKWKKYRGKNAFRYGLGARFSILNDDPKDQILNFHIGWEKRRRVFDRLAMYQGIDLFFSVGGFDLPGFDIDNDSFDFTGGIGFGPIWGFEYAINPVLSVSTEAALHIGLLSTLGTFFIPPTSLHLNYRIFKE